MAADRPAGPLPSDGIRRAGIIAWSLLGIILVAGIFLWTLNLLRDVFPPLALALILVLLLNPMVTALERRGVRRGLGTAAIYLLFIATVALAASLLFPPLGRQINQLFERAPEIEQNAIGAARRLAGRLNISPDAIGLGSGNGSPSGQPSRNEGVASFLKARGAALFAGAGRFATGALRIVLNFVLAPVFAAYLLIDLPKMRRAALHYMPPRYRREWLPLVDRIGKTVGSFFRGQLLVASIVGLLSSLLFLLVKLPFWLPIGLLAGFFNIIPLVGPFVGGGVAVLVGGMTGGPSLAVKAALAMLAVQQFDNHFITPKVVGWAVRLHPVAVMIALILGASLGGIWGMLLAVPGMGVMKILLVHFYETRVLGNWDYQEVPAGEGLVKDPGEPSEIPPQPSAEEAEGGGKPSVDGSPEGRDREVARSAEARSPGGVVP